MRLRGRAFWGGFCDGYILGFRVFGPGVLLAVVVILIVRFW